MATIVATAAIVVASCSDDDAGSGPDESVAITTSSSDGSSATTAPATDPTPVATVLRSTVTTSSPADPPGVETGSVAGVDVSALRLDQPWRPAAHFAPPFGWMNDPNGLSFVDGRWHLFFQYNPLAVDFGDIGWGHAVSDDLVSWETWPVAIEPAPGELIFSGSLVNDRNGTSPLCEAGSDPSCLVAVYTTHRERPDGTVQTQDLAVSRRAGVEFTKFDGNPVIDLALADFRDPKVFWHPPTERWVMVVVLPIEREVVLFGSSDLVDWEELSRFGPLGAVDGIWECPDLFPLPVTGAGDGAPAEKWVMKVDLNPGHVAGGSGGQYFLGEFDGTTFVPDDDDAPAPRWVDWGPDFYCATTFHEGNDERGRPLWLGWMNNWSYAGELPTFPWRGSMTAPRRLELTPDATGRLALTHSWPDELVARSGDPVDTGATRTPLPAAFLLSAELADDQDASIALRAGGEVAAEIVVQGGAVRVDRPEAGNLGPDGFAGSTPSAPAGERLTVLVDRASIEVIADDGRTSITTLILPPSGLDAIDVEGNARVEISPIS